jgi:glycosyltransferase involved in cell wall biosynthesis
VEGPQTVKAKSNPGFRLALVVPTKDRPESLRRMLKSLAEQATCPVKVAVVASGTKASEAVVAEFRDIAIDYFHVEFASISGQRNVGIEAVKDDADLIGFVDDDVVFHPGSIGSMLAFWEQAPEDVGGAGFNFYNELAPETARKWALGPVKVLYRLFLGNQTEKGKMLPSGFPTPIYPVDETIQVDWLETLAVVFRKGVLERFQGDEAYGGYDCVGFVDFTYSIGRHYRLYVVKDACVTHYCRPITNSYILGKKQILNRIYFVRKHPELSLVRCFAALVLHTGFNVTVGLMLRDVGYFKRALGNVVGLTQAAFGSRSPAAGDIK